MEVKDRELMMFGGWLCEWEWRTEGRRQWDGVFYSLLEQTSCVSTPTRLSRSLLWPSILSIGSRTCIPMGSHGSAGFSQFRILLRLLLNQAAELGSSGCGPCFLGKA